MSSEKLMMVEKSFMKVLMGTKSGKEQLKLTLTDAKSEELERLAVKHGKRSPQEIIYELIEYYLPVWRNVDTHLKQAVSRQIGDALPEAIGEQPSNKGRRTITIRDKATAQKKTGTD